MATDVSNYIAITIPVNSNTSVHRAMFSDDMQPSIRDAISAAIKVCGGASVTPVTGSWLDDTGRLHHEKGERYQFNFNVKDFDAVQAATRAIVDAVFECGELAVFRERNYVTGGYSAVILHAPTRY